MSNKWEQQNNNELVIYLHLLAVVQCGVVLKPELHSSLTCNTHISITQFSLKPSLNSQHFLHSILFETPCCPATAPKHHCSRVDLHGGMGQNTSNSVWKPCEDLQKTFDLCHCQQRVYNRVLRSTFVIDQILIFHHNLQINSLKILQCDFSGYFFLILSVIVEVYLWWKLQASLIFLSGRTCTIGGWLNTFLPPLYIVFSGTNYMIILMYTGCILCMESHSDGKELRQWENIPRKEI